MKTIATSTCLAAVLAFPLLAAAPEPSLEGLEQTAGKFVTAYNHRDAAALAALFTEDGELCDLTADDVVSGRADIQSHYEDLFADEDAPTLAIEVSSVRLVAPTLAIEDGVYHLTPPGDEDAPKQSTAYSAALLKNDAGVWQIASTRGLKDVTDAAGHLAVLADVLKGDWTCRTAEGVQLDLAFGWDPTGQSLTGEMLTTTADAEPQPGSIRIAWDAAKKSIVSWMFDSRGGTSQGLWTPTGDGWMIRSEGSTADGETLTASQQLTVEGTETLVWTATHRVIDGETQPDKTLRIVRQAPDPGDAPADAARAADAKTTPEKP